MMENKSCENCYYSTDESIRHQLKSLFNNWCTCQVDKPIDNICDKYSKGCEYCKSGLSYLDDAQFKYKDKFYCADCMANTLGIEKREYTSYQYYDIHGNFLGDSNNNELENILLDCSLVEYVGDNN